MTETKIRRATLADAEHFISIKNQLSLSDANGESTTGGFLLGTDLDTYKRFIQNDFCLVAEKENQVIGFAVVLKDATVKQSDIWLRRNQATWNIDIEGYAEKPICYFEQLAFLKGHGRDVIKICYNIICWAFENGHQHLFTTTVKEPITNLAAVPYILKGAGELVGNINETYPGIGKIKSDIYKMDADRYFSRMRQLPFYSFLEQNYVRL